MIIYTLQNINIGLTPSNIRIYEVYNFLMLDNTTAHVRYHIENQNIPYIIESDVQSLWYGFNKDTFYFNFKSDSPIHNPMELVDWFEEQEQLYQIHKLDKLI